MFHIGPKSKAKIKRKNESKIIIHFCLPQWNGLNDNNIGETHCYIRKFNERISDFLIVMTVNKNNKMHHTDALQHLSIAKSFLKIDHTHT